MLDLEHKHNCWRILRSNVLEEHAEAAVLVAAPARALAPTWGKAVAVALVGVELHIRSSVDEVGIKVAFAAESASLSGWDGYRSEGEEGEDGSEVLDVDHVCCV